MQLKYRGGIAVSCGWASQYMGQNGLLLKSRGRQYPLSDEYMSDYMTGNRGEGSFQLPRAAELLQAGTAARQVSIPSVAPREGFMAWLCYVVNC